MGLMDILSPISNLFGGGKKKDPYEDLWKKLSPYLDSAQKITEQSATEGLGNVGAARKDYDYVSSYLKKLLEGSDDELLKMLDASGATKNIDENQQQLSELGVRGGRRASILGQSGFDRDAALSNVLKQLRFSAPDKIANIAQAIGNLGLGELSASTGAGAQGSSLIFGVENLKQQDKARKSALIGSIFEAIGSVAGAAIP